MVAPVDPCRRRSSSRAASTARAHVPAVVVGTDALKSMPLVPPDSKFVRPLCRERYRALGTRGGRDFGPSHLLGRRVAAGPVALRALLLLDGANLDLPLPWQPGHSLSSGVSPDPLQCGQTRASSALRHIISIQPLPLQSGQVPKTWWHSLPGGAPISRTGGWSPARSRRARGCDLHRHLPGGGVRGAAEAGVVGPERHLDHVERGPRVTRRPSGSSPSAAFLIDMRDRGVVVRRARRSGWPLDDALLVGHVVVGQRAARRLDDADALADDAGGRGRGSVGEVISSSLRQLGDRARRRSTSSTRRAQWMASVAWTGLRPVRSPVRVS